MGRVVIQTQDDIDVEIRSKDFTEAINKLILLREKMARAKKTKSIKKFKGVAKHDVKVNDEEWYRQ